MTANFPYMLLMNRADIEIGRGRFDDARAHSRPLMPRCARTAGRGSTTSTSPNWPFGSGGGRRPTKRFRVALARASSRQAAQLHVWFCAKGCRSGRAAALARARRDADALRNWLGHSRHLVVLARQAAAEGSTVTPNAAGWLALAEAEYLRCRGDARPKVWSRPQPPGTAPTTAARGVLPLAPGRSARRRRGIPR